MMETKILRPMLKIGKTVGLAVEMKRKRRSAAYYPIEAI